MIYRLSLLALLGVALLMHVAPVPAQESAISADADIPVATVTLDRQPLFAVRGSTSLPPAERSQLISERILAFARNRQVNPDSVRIELSANGADILAGDTRLMTVAPADGAMERIDYQALARYHARKIQEAVTEYRAERMPERLLRGGLIAVAATLAFAGIWWLWSVIYRWFEARLVRHFQRKIDSLSLTAIDEGQLALKNRLAGFLQGLGWLLRLLLVVLYLQFALAQFPWTRWLSEDITSLILDPLIWIGAGMVDYLPNLLFLIVLFYVTRFTLRLVKSYFHALERRRTTLATFEPEWAMPSYKILRAFILALALIMAYPYLPGSGTEALKGISVFAGLLLSLGASSSVSSIIAGYLNTFGRVYKTGDLIQVGEIRGVVTQIRLMTTRLRTIRNEEVVIPNSVIASSSVTNFSALAREHGLMLQTEVGIGYEVPWRQVEAMLLEAAKRTPAIIAEPSPFVVQRQLGDFAVVYQLNVYTDTPVRMMRTYSALHQNVLDVFNEHGVQIMTPAYEGDPDTPKVVPKEQWFATPALPPQETPGGSAS